MKNRTGDRSLESCEVGSSKAVIRTAAVLPFAIRSENFFPDRRFDRSLWKTQLVQNREDTSYCFFKHYEE